jgi:hypothetical protein
VPREAHPSISAMWMSSREAWRDSSRSTPPSPPPTTRAFLAGSCIRHNGSGCCGMSTDAHVICCAAVQLYNWVATGWQRVVACHKALVAVGVHTRAPPGALLRSAITGTQHYIAMLARCTAKHTSQALWLGCARWLAWRLVMLHRALRLMARV